MDRTFFSLFEKEFSIFDEHFKDLIESDFSILTNISDHIFSTSGKRTRPLLLFYIHKLFSPEISKKAYLSAALIEIIHSASLLHDDVVDCSQQRRGKPSASAIWGNQTAILAGDYLLANSFLRAFADRDDTLMQMLMQVVKYMSEGELLQIEYNITPTMTRENYYSIIERKTAGLFSCCCGAGAYTAGASEKEINSAHQIGRELGLAFQIKDDLIDIDPLRNDGKPCGQDLREKKINLPTLYFLEQATEQEKEKIKQVWDTNTTFSDSTIEEILAMVRTSDAVSKCRKKMSQHFENAISILHSLNKPLPPQIENFFSFLANGRTI
ncbi:MAG: polyprenyl synthetase family protein [Bacteroidales bacterium]|jgi:octaprenyl-diphosphate synthase|nr:polyprenyl synthetase family protein [Bacteroidales bacterium]